MNVLLTCAGRRSYLVEYFRQSLAGRGLVIAVDSSPFAPALVEADRGIVVPPVDEPHYIDTLRAVCRRNAVGLLVPLNDLELPVLSRAVHEFAKDGVAVAVSRPDVIDLCFDKWRTYKFLNEHRIPTPLTQLTLDAALKSIRTGELAYPVVVKPRWGTASLGVEHAFDEVELRLAYELLHRQLSRTIIGTVSAGDPLRAVMVQQTLTGQEHGLDVLNDLQSRYAATFGRRKVSMRAGETDRAVTVEDSRLVSMGRALGAAVKHVGVLDCDVFVEGRLVSVLEMNPRFGGGYPFVHAAGADAPAALLAWAAGSTPPPHALRHRGGVMCVKQDVLQMVGLQPPTWQAT